MAHQNETRSHFFRDVHLLLVGYIIPQFLLVLLNLRGWWLIKGDVDGVQQHTALVVFTAELILLCVNIVLFVLPGAKRKIRHWITMLAMLLVHIAYIWFALASIPRIVPAAIPSWIISDFNFVAWNVTFIMPGAFLSLFFLVCRPLKIGKKKDAVYTIVTMIAVPALWYFSVTVSQPAFLYRMPEAAVISIVVVSVVILIGAVLRLFSIVIGWARHTRANTHYLIALALGIAAPIGGLYLNKSIAFPANFQSVEIYLLAFLNGLFLLVRPGEPFSFVRLFIRVIFFPFVFYFFLVFLPFLPLSIFAITVFGAGFLMLTPIALLIFQGNVIADDFYAVMAAFGKKRAVALTLCASLLLPGYLLLETLLERHALHKSIDYIYAPDIDHISFSSQSTARAAQALLKLRDRKNGVQFPYLSGIYNYIVFGNMVLPDGKIERMYRLLAGEPMPETSIGPFGTYFRARSMRGAGGSFIAPNNDVDLESVNTKSAGPGKATMRLVLRNRSGSSHSEYFALLHVPEGVFADGLRLKIDGQFEEGRIFDRKTAMWVYKKITEVRKDPALMVFRSPTTIELRVYPFPENGVREVEIDFLFPVGSKGAIKVDEQEVILNPAGSDMPLYTDGNYVVTSGDVSLPEFKREPYLHFILDCSNNTGETGDRYFQRIVDISNTLGLGTLRVSAANLNYERLGDGAILDIADTEKIAGLLRNIEIERLGGFWGEMGIKKELALHLSELRKGRFNKVPIFVLMTGIKMSELELNAIASGPLPFATPDVNRWYLDEGGTLSQRIFGEESGETPGAPQVASIIVLKKGSATAVVDPEKPRLWALPGSERLEYWDDQKKTFVAVNENEQSHPGKAWEKYAELWWTWRTAAVNPSELEHRRVQLHEKSRSLGVMIPTTSYMVVENTAQLRILERKERQALSNKGAMEFDETHTPEPPDWLLLIIVAALTVFGRSKVATLKKRICTMKTDK